MNTFDPYAYIRVNLFNSTSLLLVYRVHILLSSAQLSMKGFYYTRSPFEFPFEIDSTTVLQIAGLLQNMASPDQCFLNGGTPRGTLKDCRGDSTYLKRRRKENLPKRKLKQEQLNPITDIDCH